MCHWLTTLPGFVPYPRNLLLPLTIPLPYKEVGKQQQLSAPPSHAPIVLPSNQQQLDTNINQNVDKDHVIKDGHVIKDELSPKAITNPEVV